MIWKVSHQKARGILRKDGQDCKLPAHGDEYLLSTGAKLGFNRHYGYYIKGYAYRYQDTIPFGDQFQRPATLGKS